MAASAGLRPADSRGRLSPHWNVEADAQRVIVGSKSRELDRRIGSSHGFKL
jgi:hypothetical protein